MQAVENRGQNSNRRNTFYPVDDTQTMSGDDEVPTGQDQQGLVPVTSISSSQPITRDVSTVPTTRDGLVTQANGVNQQRNRDPLSAMTYPYSSAVSPQTTRQSRVSRGSLPVGGDPFQPSGLFDPLSEQTTFEKLRDQIRFWPEEERLDMVRQAYDEGRLTGDEYLTLENLITDAWNEDREESYSMRQTPQQGIPLEYQNLPDTLNARPRGQLQRSGMRINNDNVSAGVTLTASNLNQRGSRVASSVSTSQNVRMDVAIDQRPISSVNIPLSQSSVSRSAGVQQFGGSQSTPKSVYPQQTPLRSCLSRPRRISSTDEVQEREGVRLPITTTRSTSYQRESREPQQGSQQVSRGTSTVDYGFQTSTVPSTYVSSGVSGARPELNTWR